MSKSAAVSTPRHMLTGVTSPATATRGLNAPPLQRISEIVLIVGTVLAAAAASGPVWVVRLGVATRPGYPVDRLLPVLAALRRPERVELVEIPAADVSSTEVRARLERGEPVEDLVPPAVASRVVERGLYH